MSIMKRPPGDQFTFRAFISLSAKIQVPHDKIYVWATALNPHYQHGDWNASGEWQFETATDYRKQLTDNIKSDLVVIGLKDHLTSISFTNNDTVPDIAEYFINLFKKYSDKTFILLTSVEGLDTYIKSPNVSIIPWGGDITNHQMEYRKLDPILDKNLDSDYCYLSLNRQPRNHRAMLVSLLYELDIQDTGLISCMFKESITKIVKNTDWDVSEYYETGSIKVRARGTNINDDYKIYKTHNDNPANFKNCLAEYYKQTFVEIVSETSFTEECFNLTEKTLNSIYGACFPILICSKHSVKFLREMGLDMFDDVVNHSYDNISNPAARLEAAIIDNITLLTDIDYTKDLWVKNKDRFEKNIDFCKERMYNYYSVRSKATMDKIINESQH
tara:strand:- start:323 stop:1483 length:1161 start_codon:yes stop_codon:yes gene_type:complete